MSAHQRLAATAVDGQLARAGQQLDELRRQLSARGRLAAGRAAADRPRRQRYGDARDGEAERKDDRTRRKDRGKHRDRHAAGQNGGERGNESTQVEELQRVDVGDDARQQVPAPVTLELGGREGLDPVVHLHAHTAQHAEREVVRG